jgi:hypothetical protein
LSSVCELRLVAGFMGLPVSKMLEKKGGGNFAPYYYVFLSVQILTVGKKKPTWQ